MNLNSEKSKRCAMCFLVGFFIGVALMVFIEEAEASERDEMVVRAENLLEDFEQKSAEVGVKVYQLNRIADDDMYQVEQWNGLQLSYGDDSYLFASYEVAHPSCIYGIGKLQLMGLGSGMKIQVHKSIRVYGQIGYYFVDGEFEGTHQGVQEGVGYCFNARYSPWATGGTYKFFKKYQMAYDDAIAGEMGIELIHRFSENASLLMSVGYRSMKVRELMRVWYHDVPDEDGQCVSCWEQEITRNYSTISYGMTLSYTF